MNGIFFETASWTIVETAITNQKRPRPQITRATLQISRSREESGAKKKEQRNAFDERNSARPDGQSGRLSFFDGKDAEPESLRLLGEGEEDLGELKEGEGALTAGTWAEAGQLNVRTGRRGSVRLVKE